MATAIKRGSTWTAFWELPRVAGQRKQGTKGGFQTKKLATAYAQKQEQSVREGDYVTPTNITVSAYLERWLRDYAAPRTRFRTLEGYEGRIKRYLTPIGQVELQKLRPDMIQSLYGELVKGWTDSRGTHKAVSARTVLGAHRVLKEALSWAVKWGMLTRNPADAVAAPKPERKEITVPAPEAIKPLLEAVKGTRIEPLVKLAMYTGLRRSELLGLRWSDFNADAGTLSVQQVMQRHRRVGMVASPPKTERSRRMISLSPDTVAMLKAHLIIQRARRLELGTVWQDNDLVLAGPVGRPMNPERVSLTFSELAEKAGLKGMRLHDCRHLHASYLLAAGVHAKIVSERLGHSAIGITLDTYSHVLPGLQEQAAVAFDSVMKKVG